VSDYVVFAAETLPGSGDDAVAAEPADTETAATGAEA